MAEVNAAGCELGVLCPQLARVAEVISPNWSKKPEQNAPLQNLSRDGLHYGAGGLLLPGAGGMSDKTYLVRF